MRGPIAGLGERLQSRGLVIGAESLLERAGSLQRDSQPQVGILKARIDGHRAAQGGDGCGDLSGLEARQSQVMPDSGIPRHAACRFTQGDDRIPCAARLQQARRLAQQWNELWRRCGR
jgi:hypothetical protein